MNHDFDKFYLKPIEERKRILKQHLKYDDTLDVFLPIEVGNHMIENYLTNYEIPMGVALNFLINDKEYLVPMATEEPSVIAAASHAAKIIKNNGGFSSFVISRLMTGQIIFHKVKKPLELLHLIEQHQKDLMHVANLSHPKIVELGGGLRSLQTQIIEDFVVIYATIDTKDAMGANTINTILEAMSDYLKTVTEESILMSILSNLSTECLVEAYCEIDPKMLKHSDVIAEKISDASLIAHLDPYRATTHNKGIMNGISAVVLATGNDTRAIEASLHSYASLGGKYESLTHWTINKKGNIVGSIRIPMAVGTVGGTIDIHPKALLSKKILGFKSTEELMTIIASVGLAQNFAALYALTTDGINKGHMQLHAKSLALQAGASGDEVFHVIKGLKKAKDDTLEKAVSILNDLRNK